MKPTRLGNSNRFEKVIESEVEELGKMIRLSTKGSRYWHNLNKDLHAMLSGGSDQAFDPAGKLITSKLPTQQV